MCVEEGYKLYEQGNVIKNNFSLGRYYLTTEKFNELKKFEVEEDDILMTCAGTLGKIAIVPKGIEIGIINSVLMRFRIKDPTVIIPEYLKCIFESNIFQNEIFDNSLGTGIKNMRPGKELKQLKIPIPSLDEQKEIVINIEREKLSIDKKKREIEEITKGINQKIDSIWEIEEA